jgi:4-hydroxy-tetrahydrodipicolinate synthase
MTQTLSGLFLPLITPFRDGRLDEASLTRLVTHYAALPVDGFILGATTGEGMALEPEELSALVHITYNSLHAHAAPRPIYLGLSGAVTAKLIHGLAQTTSWPIDGYLIAAPYYLRPSQAGLLAHFTALADHAAKPILIYNIPYRTGVNISNETMLALAAHHNIIGVKDCCADPSQTFDLIRQKAAENFAVLTGEDAHYYSALVSGADGAILASAHVQTSAFAQVQTLLRQGDQPAALALWRGLADIPRLLFAEPSPAAIKYWLWRNGLIASPEMRLPMVQISDDLATRIDAML